VSGGRLRSIGAVVLAVVLCSAPAASAGGDFVDLTAAGGRVWFVGEIGVRELDASSGRVLWSPQPTVAAYPLSIAVAGGAAWVASIENGYVAGRLSRIDLRTRRARIVLRNPAGSVLYVASGGGSVWALLGNAAGNRLARLDTAGRLLHVWRLPGAGRMDADESGCWISTDTAVLHVDRAGRLHRLPGFVLGDITAGDGAVWLPQQEAPRTTIVRIDERTGRVRTLRTQQLRLGGFQHDLAAGGGALWALSEGGRAQSRVVRLDARTGATTGTARLPGIADSLAVTPDAVWVATVVAPPARPATGFDVVRLDPRTLRRELLVRVR
jgi:streptogramin lyase